MYVNIFYNWLYVKLQKQKQKERKKSKILISEQKVSRLAVAFTPLVNFNKTI